MTHPLEERKHLEAVLVGRRRLDPAFGDGVVAECLSPAAIALLDFIAEEPMIAHLALEAGAFDEYQQRLARRAAALTCDELSFFEESELVAMINRLPAIGRRRWAA